jgi:hypothetical protein
MKRSLLLIACLLLLPLMAKGQLVINNFDAVPSSEYWSVYGNADAWPQTYVTLSQETNQKHGGDGALKVNWQNKNYDQWGGWIGMTHYHPEALGLYDFSPYTDISLWYYNATPQSKPGKVEFRIILYDAGPGTDHAARHYEIWISHHLILDKAPGWNQILVKMEDGGDQAAAWNPGAGKSFWNPQWGQDASVTQNSNRILDLDKLAGWGLEFSQDGTLWQQPDDTVSGVIILDDFELQGAAPINLVMFNGKATPGGISMSVGWSGSAEITNEEDFTGGTNSIKWTCGAGWDGVNFMFENPKNLIYNWSKDSIQLKVKAPADIGDLLLIFHDMDEDGAVKVDYPFQATYQLPAAKYGYDGTWKQIKVALKDFNCYNGCWDNDLGQTVPGMFDSTRIKQFTVGGFGQAFEGKVVYLDDIWTGNPSFDWVPPAVVTSVNAVPLQYYNLVIWEDVAGENGESYTVYASTSPITDLTAPGIELVTSGVLENVKTAVHWIYYPLKDMSVKYYYAVTCADASGNVGPAGVSGAITNTALGVPTISMNPPANFKADGDLSEWDVSGIKPWVIKPETDHVATGEVTNAADLTATVYLAMDADNLYIAIDVIDNIFSYSTEGDWWNWDAFEFFIGLYDWRTMERHNSIKRGVEPDYKLVLLQSKLMNDFNTSATIYTPDHENYHFEALGAADYVAEAKVPFAAMVFGGDQLFKPRRGMKIPFDLYFHDNDGTTVGDWEGNLSYSPNNFDHGWENPREWTYTWIGDTTRVTAVEQDDEPAMVTSYFLSQNYPNPFNPTTTIVYALPQAGHVRIELYNSLGQKIRTLLNDHKVAGSYTLDFSANDLPSGIYLYKMESGKFTRTMKMVLMK